MSTLNKEKNLSKRIDVALAKKDYKKTFKDDSLNIQDNELTCSGEYYDKPKQIGIGGGMGVIVPTLHGDGVYDIKADYNKYGKIISITIKL